MKGTTEDLTRSVAKRKGGRKRECGIWRCHWMADTCLHINCLFVVRTVLSVRDKPKFHTLFISPSVYRALLHC